MFYSRNTNNFDTKVYLLDSCFHNKRESTHTASSMCHFFLIQLDENNIEMTTLIYRFYHMRFTSNGLVEAYPLILSHWRRRRRKNRAHVNSEWRWYQDMSTEKTCPFHPLHRWIDGKRISTLFLAYWATSWEMTTFQYSLTFSLFHSFISSTFEYGLYCIFIPYQGIFSRLKNAGLWREKECNTVTGYSLSVVLRRHTNLWFFEGEK